MVKRISFLLAVVLFALPVSAQVTALQEKQPETVNGVEYGYYIRNQQEKNVKDEAYSRFELTLYAVNKSGCTKIFPERSGIVSSSETQNLIASFSCINANGKRLTAKGGTVKAKDFYVTVKVKEDNKEVTRTAKAGYIFRNGETLSNTIIVLVPTGERPNMQCSINSLPEL